MSSTHSRCQCKTAKSSPQRASHVATILSGAIIAILPKCPFCILAYSSAITMCGSAANTHASSWMSYISIGLVGLTCLFLLLNYRGVRTLFALALVLLGGGFIMWSELYSGLIQPYYWGSMSLLFGVWVNGSFLYVYRMLFRFLKKSLKQFSHQICYT